VKFLTTTLFLCLLASSGARAEQYQKMPGATNPRIEGDEKFDFKCLPTQEHITISSEGEVQISGKKPKHFRLPELGTGERVTYLECFVHRGELVATFESTDGEDGACFIAKMEVDTMKKDWVWQFPCLNMGVPALTKDHLYVGFTGQFAKYRLKDGKEVWKKPYPCRSFVSPDLTEKAVSFTCLTPGEGAGGADMKNRVTLSVKTGDKLK
jgi:hypothetical protein